MPSEPAKTQQCEARAYRRVTSTIPAQLFWPETDEVMRCTIVDLSAGGACVVAPDRLTLDGDVVLYIEGFGRFEGVVVRHDEGVFGVQFHCGPLKRQRLADNIAEFALKGLKTPTLSRRGPRRPLLENGYFVRPCGKKVRYDVLDISLHGISVITNERPPVGEILNLGRCYGRVSRHHDAGIAIEFINGADAPPVLSHGC